MNKSGPQRRSRVDRVIQFFREASKDEIKAVILLLQMEALIPTEQRGAKRGRKSRLNGTISSQHTDLSQSEAFKSREATA